MLTFDAFSLKATAPCPMRMGIGVSPPHLAAACLQFTHSALAALPAKPPLMVAVNLSPLAFLVTLLLTALSASAVTVFLLRKRSGAREHPVPREHPPNHAQPAKAAPPAVAAPDFQPVKLIFGETKDSSPIMEISSLRAGALPQGRRRLDPATIPLSAFSAFLQRIPATLTAAEFGPQSYFQILVRAQLAFASGPHSFLPFVQGAGGAREDLARLGNSEQLRQMIGGGIAWQLAFLAVAQPHLAEIGRKIDYVRKGVDEIKEFLTNERRSQITGTLDYLRQVVRTLGQKESPSAPGNQLENIERELLQIQNHVMRDLGASAAKIGAIVRGRFESRKAQAKTIERRAGEMYELEKEWLLCMVARAINWQVLAVFRADRQLKLTRKETICKSIDEFTALLQRLYGDLYEKTGSVRSPLDSFSMAQQDKSQLVQFDLRRRLIDDNKQISSDAVAIRGEVRKFSNQLWSPQKPVVLALKLDGSRIVEAFELDSV